MLKIDVGEIGEIYGHFADGITQFGVVQLLLCLNKCGFTAMACSTSSY